MPDAEPGVFTMIFNIKNPKPGVLSCTLARKRPQTRPDPPGSWTPMDLQSNKVLAKTQGSRKMKSHPHDKTRGSATAEVRRPRFLPGILVVKLTHGMPN